MPTLKYRDPDDGQFKPAAVGAPGPTGATGPSGPAGVSGGIPPPIGLVIMYGGSVAPSGWHLCDGSAHGSAALDALIGPNTPDLRDKFVLAAGGAYAVNATGGAATVTLTAAQSGLGGHGHSASQDHTHVVDPPPTNTDNLRLLHSHTALPGWDFAWATMKTNSGAGGSAYWHTGGYTDLTSTSVSMDHTHTYDIPNFNLTALKPAATLDAAAALNATAPHENIPPFWALTYIVRTT